MKLHGTMTVNNDELYIGGVSCLELSKKYQTPLYVFDEALVRQNCREYIEYFKAREGKIRLLMQGKLFYLFTCVIL
ncbi:hypothetical protein ACK2FJ_03880 [Clostridioides difficile]